MRYYDSENVSLNHWLFAKNQLNGLILDKSNPESQLSYKGSCPVPRVLDKPWQPQLGSLKIYLCTSDKTPEVSTILELLMNSFIRFQNLFKTTTCI